MSEISLRFTLPKSFGINRWGQRAMVSFLAVLGLWLSGCASTTEEGAVGAGRKQLLLVPSEQIEASSAEAYEQTKTQARQKGVLDQKPDLLRRLQNISQRLVPTASVFRAEAQKWAWEVHTITSDEINAYCMPGGKIMFYTGLVEKLQLTDGEIAAVMGHEIAHALREHGRERISEEMIKQLGVEILVGTGKVKKEYAGLLGTLTTVAVSLPHGRGQETEADEIGLELMARAAYNPQEALSLWRKMAAQGGGKPPEILSTHPADSKRLAHIESLLPKVMPLYRK